MPDLGTGPLAAQHRVLRLIMAVGAVAVGLCVVLAMVALVIRLGDSPARTITRTSNVGATYPGPSASATGQASGLALASYLGRGSGERTFRLRAAGRIALAWSYRCPPGRAARFVLGQALVPADHGIDQDRSGPSGGGITVLTENAGRHVLVVVSDCNWSIRVLRRAP